MGSMSFPSKEMMQLASFEARLGEDLSLQDIEEIEQQIVGLNQTTDKTRGIAVGLFNRLEAKKPALIDRGIVKMEQASDPVSKIKLLTPLIGYLEPSAVDEKLEAIKLEASLCDQKIQDAVQKQLEHLEFAQQKPVIYEVEGLRAEMERIAQKIEESGTLDALKLLNPVQLGEVRRAIARIA